MSPESREALHHHIAKWHRREPEMALAEVFCPAGQRERFRAWGALLFELREAVFELSDARVTAVKAGWWAETLLALGKGQARHPLTEPFHSGIQVVAVPWSGLARAVLETLHYEGRPATLDEALSSLRPLATAIADVEAALFSGHAEAGAWTSVAVHFLLQRLPAGLAADDAARVPLNLLARHGLTVAQLAVGQGDPVLRDWARDLGGQLPRSLTGGCLYRRLRTAFDRVRLQRLADGRGFAPPPAAATVWRAWRVARSA